jgi:hypothetical protein
MPLEPSTHLVGKAAKLDARVRLVVTAGTMLLRDQAQAYAPLLYGHLTRGLKVKEAQITPRGIVGTLFSEMAYWKYLELSEYTAGKHLGKKSVAKGSKMPFLKPAYKAKRAQIKKLMRDGFRIALRDISIR